MGWKGEGMVKNETRQVGSSETGRVECPLADGRVLDSGVGRNDECMRGQFVVAGAPRGTARFALAARIRGVRGAARRRGGVYILVLGSGVLVMVIGLSALMAIRVERWAAEGSTDLVQARVNAQTAIDMGMWRISQNPNWRTTYVNGVWELNRNTTVGSYTLSGVDPIDANLSDDVMDPLLLMGTGQAGQATYRLQATLTADAKGVGALTTSLSAGGGIALNGATVTSDQTISSNSTVTSTGSVVNADVESVGAIGGSGYAGTTTTPVEVKTFPDGTAFDYYIANGTVISMNTLTRVLDTTRSVVDSILSDSANPYGAVNPQGIYVIPAAGARVYIGNSEIKGTLVILDPGPGSRISGNVHAVPGALGLPTILVRGNMEWRTSDEPDTGLLYATLSVVNLEFVVEDRSALPNAIEGLVYVSGNLNQTSGKMNLDGLLMVGGSVNSSGTMNITYQAGMVDDPSPGFAATAKMVFAAGSWRPIVN